MLTEALELDDLVHSSDVDVDSDLKELSTGCTERTERIEWAHRLMGVKQWCASRRKRPWESQRSVDQTPTEDAASRGERLGLGSAIESIISPRCASPLWPC
jgi:hypothetical protein